MIKKSLLKSFKNNISEIYTGLVLIVFIPTTVGFITNLCFGLLLSFLIQATIGILIIRKSK